MGKGKGFGELGRMARERTKNSYQLSLLQCPIVSVWDCTLRKMTYSFRPGWM